MIILAVIGNEKLSMIFRRIDIFFRIDSKDYDLNSSTENNDKKGPEPINHMDSFIEACSSKLTAVQFRESGRS